MSTLVSVSLLVTIECGLTPPTRALLLLRFTSLPSAPAPSRAPSDGGRMATEFTTDTPIPTRTPTPFARASCTPTWAGWFSSRTPSDRVELTSPISTRMPSSSGSTRTTSSAFSSWLLLPAIVAGLGWGDWWGGLVYAGILRVCFVQQATFCVNSLAHWLGDQPFDDRNSPRDHVITALVTLGEGYHNFHHEFPSDYRNAIEWWQYDPTKWSIWLWKQLGLAYELKEFRANEIEKGRVQQLQKKLDQKRATLDWGIPLEQLPVVDWDDFVAQSKAGKGLVAIAGVIHDVTDFIKDHPGGKALINSAIGKDATAIFNGGVYLHSNAAHNLLSTMRVGVLRGGCEVEIWKRAQFENKDITYMNDSAGQRIIRAGSQATKIVQPAASADAA
ncbi:hypothetical protein NXS19_010027 [Fusarium pseudograminearum]|nr:hypothetical protein NXS19_010027 [Fusarium pseudograminearum]